jgi:hypothetical protein
MRDGHPLFLRNVEGVIVVEDCLVVASEDDDLVAISD